MEPPTMLKAKFKSNGLRVLLVPTKCETFDIQLLMKVGTFSENDKQFEFAHFLEHLNAQFTSKKWPTQHQVISKIESFGVEWNAFTASRYTGYYIKGSCSHDWNDASHKIWELLDIMGESYFNFEIDEEIFMQEVNAVKQELSGYASSANSIIGETQNQQMYPGHSASVTIEQRLENMTNNAKDTLKFKRKILEFRNRYYGPKNSLLTIAVPIHSKKTAETELRAFWSTLKQSVWKSLWKTQEVSISASDIILFKPVSSAPPSQSKRKTSSTAVATSIAQVSSGADVRSTILVSMKIHNVIHENRTAKVAFKFICFLLSSGFDSRLIKKLRTERGLIYSVYAYADYDRYDPNLNVLTVQTSCDSKDAVETHELIVEQLKELASKADEITNEQLASFKNVEVFAFQDMRYNNNPSKWIDNYGRDILFGDNPHTFTESLNEIQNLTLETTRRVLREHLFAKGELFVTFNAPPKKEEHAPTQEIAIQNLYKMFLKALKQNLKQK